MRLVTKVCLVTLPLFASGAIGSSLWASPAKDDQDAPPWDLLRIARKESERATAQLAADIGERLSSAALTPNLAERQEKIQALADIGPDVVPVILRYLERLEDSRQAFAEGEVAVRTLLCIASTSERSSVLSDLQNLLEKARYDATRLAILRGLEGLDHPRALQMAEPYLTGSDESLARAAIQVVASQKSPTAAGLLRPLLDGRPTLRVQVMRALRHLDDSPSADAVSSLLSATESPEEIDAAVDFLRDLGDRTAVSPLIRVLRSRTEPWANSVRDSVRESAAVAIREVGLRSELGDRQLAARELAKAWKDVAGVRLKLRIAMALGPLGGNDEVFATYEDEYKRKIKDSKNDPRPYLDLADLQCTYGKWKDARINIEKVQLFDRGERSLDIPRAILLSRWYSGTDRFEDAQKELMSLPIQDFSALPVDYPEFRRMASMETYREFFAPR